MPGMLETRETNEGAEQRLGDIQVFDLNAELTQIVLEKFEVKVHRLARDHGYFYDKPDGAPYSPYRVYEMTEKIALGALTAGGTVDVIVPSLELRHKRNGEHAFIPQLQAREFAIQSVRLNAIQRFAEAGTLSKDDAFRLAGNQDPKEALERHKEAWQEWLESTRRFEREQVLARESENRVEVGALEVIEPETDVVTKTAPKTAKVSSRASYRRKVIRAVVTVGLLATWLASCLPGYTAGDDEQPVGTSTPAGEVFTPTADAGAGGPEPTVESTVGPTPAPFSTEAAPTAAVYGPPSMSGAEYLPGSGGSGRNEIITKAGVPEAKLVVYENAAYALAEASGYARTEVVIEYLFDGNSWNMVLRRVATGNILWSEDGEGAQTTYPTILKVDEQGIHPGDGIVLREVENTKDAKAVLVNGFVIALRSPVTINGKQYYSEWFNTLTRTWEKIAEVIAAVPVGKAVTTESFTSIGWNSFPEMSAEQVPFLEQKILADPKLTANIDSVTPVTFTVNKGANGVSVAMYGTPENLTTRYIGSMQTPEGIVHMVFWEAIVQGEDGKNVRVVVVSAHEPRLEEFRDAQLRYLQEIGKTVFSTKVTLITLSTSDQTSLWKALLASSPDGERMAQWLIDNLGSGQVVIATNIQGR